MKSLKTINLDESKIKPETKILIPWSLIFKASIVTYEFCYKNHVFFVLNYSVLKNVYEKNKELLKLFLIQSIIITNDYKSKIKIIYKKWINYYFFFTKATTKFTAIFKSFSLT